MREIRIPSHRNVDGCNWNIEVPKEQHIELAFDKNFKLDGGITSCSIWHWLRLYDGGNSSSPKITTNFCDDTKPNYTLSSGNQFFLDWLPPYTYHSYSGFTIHVSPISKSSKLSTQAFKEVRNNRIQY